MPIYIDSQLAIHATEIFCQYRSFFDRETKAVYEAGGDSLSLPNLHYSLTTQ